MASAPAVSFMIGWTMPRVSNTAAKPPMTTPSRVIVSRNQMVMEIEKLTFSSSPSPTTMR